MRICQRFIIISRTVQTKQHQMVMIQKMYSLLLVLIKRDGELFVFVFPLLLVIMICICLAKNVIDYRLMKLFKVQEVHMCYVHTAL